MYNCMLPSPAARPPSMHVSILGSLGDPPWGFPGGPPRGELWQLGGVGGAGGVDPPLQQQQLGTIWGGVHPPRGGSRTFQTSYKNDKIALDSLNSL